MLPKSSSSDWTRPTTVFTTLTVAATLGGFALGCSNEGPASGSGGAGPAVGGAGAASTGSGGSTTDAGGTSQSAGGADTAATGGASGGQGASASTEPVYIKATNTDPGDLFGISVALSGDAQTLAIGANREASSGAGVNANQDDNSQADTGAVYVYAKSGSAWQGQAYLKASNASSGDGFGGVIALSADGTTLAVGAPYEASVATGVDGNGDDDSVVDSGAVYLFSRNGNTWQQQAYVKASTTDEGSFFGTSVALSADGSTLAVGAEGEGSSATGVDGEEADTTAPEAGAVYVFKRTGTSWQQAAYIKASNTDAGDHFGGAVTLSADGTTLAVGAYWEDSIATDVDGDQSDNSARSAGAAYLFAVSGTSWAQQAYLKPAYNDGYGYDNFGSSVSLSADGNLLAVGAAGDASAATGVGGDPSDHSVPYAGAAYLFSRQGSTWQQLAYLKASHPGEGDEFGNHVVLSGSGATLAVGAALEASSGSDGSDNSAGESGAAYVFRAGATSWQQDAFLKASNVGAGDHFATSLSLSQSGEELAVGASREASMAAGVGGDQLDNSAAMAGAAYVFPNLTSLQQP